MLHVRRKMGKTTKMMERRKKKVRDAQGERDEDGGKEG